MTDTERPDREEQRCPFSRLHASPPVGDGGDRCLIHDDSPGRAAGGRERRKRNDPVVDFQVGRGRQLSNGKDKETTERRSSA